MVQYTKNVRTWRFYDTQIHFFSISLFIKFFDRLTGPMVPFMAGENLYNVKKVEKYKQKHDQTCCSDVY